MCYRCAEENEAELAAQEQDEIDKPWDICDDFSYTLKSFGLVNRVERSFWASNLATLLLHGSEAAAKHKKDFFDPWGEY